MSLWRKVRGWLSRERPAATLPPADRGADVLVYLGVNHSAVGWARGQRCGLEHIWERCPRADWLLQIALGAGVGKRELAGAVRRSIHGDAVEQITAAWLRGEVSDEGWWRRLGQVDDERVDRLVPKVAAHSGGEGTDDLAGFTESRDEDAKELAARSEFLDTVRHAVPYQVIHALVYAPNQPPYRA